MLKKLYIVTILLIAIFAMLLYCSVGCAEVKNVVSETPIDTQFIPAHSEIQTDHEYKYNALKGEWVLLPVTKTVYVPDCYKVQYEVVYDNGKKETVWREVDKSIYEKAEKALAERSRP